MAKKVILITGGSSGIGAACANWLAKSPLYKVYATSRSPQKKTNNISWLQLDLNSSESIKTAFQELQKAEEKLDVLINNAGIGIAGPLEETPISWIKDVFSANVFGLIEVTQNALPLLKKAESGKIINISSIAAEMGLPFRAAYSAAKASVEMLSEALGMELKPFNIQVCTLQPGDIKTNINQNRLHVELKENSPYFEKNSRLIKLVNNEVNNGLSPDEVSKKIETLIQKNKIPTRVRVAPFLARISIDLRYWLPTRLFTKLLSNHYKI